MISAGFLIYTVLLGYEADCNNFEFLIAKNEL